MPAPVPPSAAPVVPGYVLEEMLGRGGSGQVWRARPRDGGAPVAVKVLLRGDPERQEREARLLAELDHPHLVRLHRVVRREVRGGPAEVSLVLELLAGGSLAALLARRGRLRPGEVVTTVAPVAAALAQAHERGVVHGDLSPGNVLFTAEGRPVLTDLGTARLVGDTARAEVTPPYVDPVVARGGAPGPASDVFGVAAAAFHALTGIAPWNAADPGETLVVAAAGQLPDLALLAPEAPPELVRVVLRGLSADPHLRGTAAAFALDLRHACRPEPVRLPVTGVPDHELGATGRGPRTELTHQVPGRRPRAAHAAPAPAGRWSRLGDAVSRVARGLRRDPDPMPVPGRRWVDLRRLLVPVVVLATVVLGLGGAAWIGTHWGAGTPVPVPAADGVDVSPGEPDEPVSPAPSTPAPTAPAPDTPAPAAPAPSTPAPGSSSPGTAAEGEPLGDGPTAAAAMPTDPGEWRALLAELYERRAGAFMAADAAAVAAVHLPGSALAQRDLAQVEMLAAAGRVLAGFEPRVSEVQAVTVEDDDRAVLEVLDTLPGYRVTDAAGGLVQEVPARGEARVRMVLQFTATGWRIAAAERLT
ncbi:serine/threonine-protein kinase [Modestobacter roseus]|uniref:non-specific serine/threonine protein kinase n=1 Tax=Modestobacter roseus TaxID=1181884 RepID=A0A562INW9_9ACTN|nr:serine/threonine-protein kinase [Modestobacter roseus]MQA32450.1 protein kinase [Modestobacter roseus]TWH72284.1 serine/threonine protein kinase [Modestobacter roseus]